MAYDEKIQQQMQQEYEAFQNTKMKIALVGQPGAGKSSLTNKILGKKIFEVSPRTDMTVKADSQEFGKLVITDLPGYGTKMFPVDEWVEKFHVDSEYDMYLFVFSGKLHDSDGKLFAYLEKWKRERKHPYFVVRNKADEIWDDEKTDEELREIIRKDVQSKFEASGLEAAKVYFTSCRRGDGIEELRNDIQNSDIEDVKKGKFIAAFKARSIADLDKKKEECLNNIKYYAMGAAANGLNPIPGADMAVDVGIVFKMFSDIRETFDLDSTKQDTYIETFGPAAANVMNTVGKDQIVKMLSKCAGKVAGKSAIKYIPVLGQMVAAGIGYTVTYAAGEKYVDNCYNLAKAIMESSASSIVK